MCGILDSFHKSEPPYFGRRFSATLNALHHRGPDDCGEWLHREPWGTLRLGHTRLSILDLSPTGHQSMHSRCGRWTITYNGEIYNYKELTMELKQQ